MATFVLLITFANSLNPGQAQQKSGLIWIQTVWHSDGIPERLFLQKLILKIHKQQKSMQNYPACKELVLSKIAADDILLFIIIIIFQRK